MKVFTDNIVVGAPIRSRLNNGEYELLQVLNIFGELQATLAVRGFFIRGGIAVGDMYMDRDVVFGDALLQAVEMDKHGGPPRLVLCPSTFQLLQEHIAVYNARFAPQASILACDEDGSVFVDYLAQGVAAFPEGGVFLNVFRGHRRQLQERLKKHAGDPDTLSKYHWAARYHNFFCGDFARKHRPTDTEDYDEWTSACRQAQTLQQQLIPGDFDGAGFRRIGT